MIHHLYHLNPAPPGQKVNRNIRMSMSGLDRIKHSGYHARKKKKAKRVKWIQTHKNKAQRRIYSQVSKQNVIPNIDERPGAAVFANLVY